MIRGSNPFKGKTLFSSPKSPTQQWGQLSLLLDMYRGYSSGVERPGREFDHSCLVIRLRRSGAKHPLPLNAIVTRTGKAVPLPDETTQGRRLLDKPSMEYGKCSLTCALDFGIPVSQPYCVCWHSSSCLLIR
jgi:hypothetical protein